MRYGSLPPKVLLPLAVLLGIVLLILVVLVGKALTRKGEELPPTGSEHLSAPAPLPLLPPQQASSPWEHLTAKDLEEAMEDQEDAQDTLDFLRSRVEAHARRKRLPLPPL